MESGSTSNIDTLTLGNKYLTVNIGWNKSFFYIGNLIVQAVLNRSLLAIVAAHLQYIITDLDQNLFIKIDNQVKLVWWTWGFRNWVLWESTVGWISGCSTSFLYNWGTGSSKDQSLRERLLEWLWEWVLVRNLNSGTSKEACLFKSIFLFVTITPSWAFISFKIFSTSSRLSLSWTV